MANNSQKLHARVRALCEGALMVALALVLSALSDLIPFLQLPRGGSITLFSMVPILVMGYRNGWGWGLLTAFVHSLIQLYMGFDNLAYCVTLRAQIGCVLLDYVLAYTVLGLAELIARGFKKRGLGLGLSAAAVCALRFVCSFLSGYIVWYDYSTATEWMNGFALGQKLVASMGQSGLCWIYSLLYNLSYMLPETVITVLGVLLLYKAAPRIFAKNRA